ncbi:MAG: lipopolysaccharide heptosyltransferase II [Candidatus Omnitrophota bacterium]|jgi:lipopolysaccharide heptosyltransferase II|nr:lipopolysaccharide heptosyltransferase II [Candidatus Omnitrophota bacterium]
MKRILVVNVNWLGDTIFATPVFKALRENFPEAYIAVLTHPRCVEILEGNPNINEIILYEEKGRDRHLINRFALISQLKSKKFDFAVILRKSLSRTMILFLSKIPERIGYGNRRSGFLLTKRILLPAKNTHRVDYFLGLLRAIGINPRSTGYEFFVTKEDKANGDELLKKEGLKSGENFIVINPGGNWDLKRWPKEKFAKLGDAISRKFNIRIILTGADKDIQLCKSISKAMKNKPIVCCGKTNLKTLGAIFQKAKWVIANDSGPMHIAAAVKTPVIALFGPTSPDVTGPYGDGVYRVLHKEPEPDCEIPCYNLECEDNKCMKAIDVEDVLEAISL